MRSRASARFVEDAARPLPQVGLRVDERAMIAAIEPSLDCEVEAGGCDCAEEERVAVGDGLPTGER